MTWNESPLTPEQADVLASQQNYMDQRWLKSEADYEKLRAILEKREIIGPLSEAIALECVGTVMNEILLRKLQRRSDGGEEKRTS